jgi:hypothetical protein
MPEQEVSHLEIYRLLIEVKTTLDMALKQRAEDKKRDDDEKLSIFERLNGLERTVWVGLGIAIACSVAIPLLVNAAAPRLHFPQSAAVEARPNGQ